MFVRVCQITNSFFMGSDSGAGALCSVRMIKIRHTIGVKAYRELLLLLTLSRVVISPFLTLLLKIVVVL